VGNRVSPLNASSAFSIGRQIQHLLQSHRVAGMRSLLNQFFSRNGVKETTTQSAPFGITGRCRHFAGLRSNVVPATHLDPHQNIRLPHNVRRCALTSGRRDRFVCISPLLRTTSSVDDCSDAALLSFAPARRTKPNWSGSPPAGTAKVSARSAPTPSTSSFERASCGHARLSSESERRLVPIAGPYPLFATMIALLPSSCFEEFS
jgi:hypothetical protein